jgi:NitT/TauT family transport system permease protein
MQRRLSSQRYASVPDLAILLLVATTIYGVYAISKEWRSEFHPVTEIDLSVWALPYYTLMSGIRGAVAYFISLIFTLVVGYIAANSKQAEKIIIPMLDILQSIPVLGFLPGLLLGLVALFPHTNTGLELAAIIMIFTGQVWNMTFSYYSSLKSVPTDFREASTIIGLNWRQRLRGVELPFSAVNLAWNSLLSMAGGWFFLIPCEAITLGDKEYRLPGIGAYMDVAIKKGDSQAVAMAVIAMVLLIVMMDFVIWRPILSWVQKFRLEEISGISNTEPLMKLWIRESKIVRWVQLYYRDRIARRHARAYRASRSVKKAIQTGPSTLHAVWVTLDFIGRRLFSPRNSKVIGILGSLGVLGLIFYGSLKLLGVLREIPVSTWIWLVRDMLWTCLRVIFALTVSTLWAVPVGIWLGTSPKRIKIAQPLIQILASFPAPMLYPLALSVLFGLGISFDWAAMFLMLLGVQWYVLFNVLAGALRIPKELNYALELMETSTWDKWKTLYLPSVFPSLVTGWVTAAGGAWNASVVAEYIFYKGRILKTGGLGASLSVATAEENFTLFAASLTLMIFSVIILNRLVWSKLYDLAQNRFRMEV